MFEDKSLAETLDIFNGVIFFQLQDDFQEKTNGKVIAFEDKSMKKH